MLHAQAGKLPTLLLASTACVDNPAVDAAYQHHACAAGDVSQRRHKFGRIPLNSRRLKKNLTLFNQ